MDGKIKIWIVDRDDTQTDRGDNASVNTENMVPLNDVRPASQLKEKTPDCFLLLIYEL